MGALAIWDPGGRPPRERTLEPKGPIEAMNIALGIDAPQQNVALGIIAHKKTPGCAESNQSASTIPKSQPCTSHPSSWAPIVKEPIHFPFEAHQEGMVSSWAMQSRDIATRTLQRGRLVAVTPMSHRHHMRPRAMHTLVHWQRSSMRSHNRSIQSLRAPVFIWRHFAAVPRMSVK